MEDRAIVVTGASTGIGRECVRLLASQGYRVFAGVRTPQDAQALVQEVPQGLTPVFLDVTDATSIRAAVEVVSKARSDGLYGLVNNAGITVAGPLEVLPIDALRRQIEVNVIGPVAVTQAFLPLLRKARGRIVLMGSILGRVALPYVGAYSISKFALEAVTDSLGMELAESGVSVSLMEPGNIATPIWAKSKQRFLDTMNGNPGMELYRARMDSVRRGDRPVRRKRHPAHRRSTGGRQGASLSAAAGPVPGGTGCAVRGPSGPPGAGALALLDHPAVCPEDRGTTLVRRQPRYRVPAAVP